jgi:Asp/Glu/hydantoin racemase
MGVEARLAGEIPMNLSIESLLDPVAARAGLVAAARALAAQGAGAVILGCTGMAGHRAALEQAAGVPVIEPCQAAAAAALGILAAAGEGAQGGARG